MPHPDEIEAARAAIGSTETVGQTLDVESLRRFAVAIGGERQVEIDRPLLAHWAWFLSSATDSEIGEDGHPRRGGFLPELASFPRRMFASTAIAFEASLLLDERATMTSRIADVRHKSGRSGDLVFVDIEKIIEQRDTIRIVETQTLAYRQASEVAPAPLPVPEHGIDDTQRQDLTWTPGPVQLFRFSAATFNAHRIHYDLAYARDIEGHPSLIVHGPLIAAKLAALFPRLGEVVRFAFRAQAPCFVDQAIRLVRVDADKAQAWRCDNTVAAVVSATYR